MIHHGMMSFFPLKSSIHYCYFSAIRSTDIFAIPINLTVHTGVDSSSEALLKTPYSATCCEGWYESDNSIDESLAFTAADENSCIDAF